LVSEHALLHGGVREFSIAWKLTIRGLKKAPLGPIFVHVSSKKGPLNFKHAIQKLYFLKASYIFHFVWEFTSA